MNQTKADAVHGGTLSDILAWKELPHGKGEGNDLPLKKLQPILNLHNINSRFLNSTIGKPLESYHHNGNIDFVL
jgi:hypothetical protein